MTSKAEPEDSYSPPSEEVVDVVVNVTVNTRSRLPLHRRLAYGVGHVFNDMCASMWFTYLLLFYHRVIHLNNVYAGMLLLFGQVADACATPVVGFLCDRTRIPYGRRKTWHLAGTIMVAASFFFFWHSCIHCEHAVLSGQIVYFTLFIVVFQFGWASVQISHLSLIPELTKDESERVGLNAIRYAFTILSNMAVFVTIFILLEVVGSKSNKSIGPSDEWIFSGTALGVIAVGLVFAAIFHLGTKEPSTPAEQRLEMTLGTRIPLYMWFSDPRFYLVAVIYMCTRLVVNLTQVYTPLYLVDTLHLSKTSVAIGPLVIFVSGFVTTFILRYLNRVIGRYMTYFCGLALVWGALLWFWQQPVPRNTDHSQLESIIVYGATILLGAGGSTLLVTSLSMVADLIGCTVGSSAFVYGLMSFTDKLSNGVTIQIIQALHPCKGNHDAVCCSACASYYRYILVGVPGGASLLALVALAFLVLLIYMRRQQCTDVAPPVAACTERRQGAHISSSEENKSIQIFQKGSEDNSLDNPNSYKGNCDENRPLLGGNQTYCNTA